MKGSIDSIESFGLVDGPGIRTVVFFSGCKLRCIYCHNPEMWVKKKDNYTSEELVKKILRNKPYFGKNGGVTFSGGEALCQVDFLIETCKLLKKENIHIALDTCGVGNGKYEEVLDYVDLVIFDVKGLAKEDYKKMTRYDIDESLKFLEICQKKNKKMWIRSVIVPGINDNEEFVLGLKKIIRTLKNVEKVELLPYHTLGVEKYKKLNISYPLDGVEAMDAERCKKLQDILTEKI